MKTFYDFSKYLLICLLGVLLLTFLTGCETDAMTHAEWEREQEQARKAAEMGQTYKTRSQIKKEAAETRKAVEGITFEK